MFTSLVTDGRTDRRKDEHNSSSWQSGLTETHRFVHKFYFLLVQSLRSDVCNVCLIRNQRRRVLATVASREEFHKTVTLQLFVSAAMLSIRWRHQVTSRRTRRLCHATPSTTSTRLVWGENFLLVAYSTYNNAYALRWYITTEQTDAESTT